MTRRRILVVTRWHPTPGRPDWAPFLRDWTEVAARLGDVRVLHLDTTAPRGWQVGVTEDGFPIDRVGLRTGGTRHPVQHASNFREGRHAVKVATARHGITLVHAHAYPAAVLLPGGVLRPPVVVTEHFTRLLRGDLGFPQRLEARRAYQRADEVTVVGPALIGPVARLLRRDPVVIPNPVRRSDVVTPLELPFDPVRILCAGRLERIKGYDTLLKAVSLLVGEGRSIVVQLFGEGPERPQLQAIADALGLAERVEFVGGAPRESVLAAMRAAHIVAVPSRFETFSLVAAEALARGRPVVATRSGGPEYFIDESRGALAAPDDASGLAAAISETVDRLPQFDSQAMSEGILQEFGPDVVTGRLEAVYQRAEAARGS